MIYKIRFTLALLACLSAPAATAQILFAESFNVILDSTRKVKGSITPEVKIQTQKELLVELKNQADITMRLGRNNLTLANKVEFSKFGDDVFLSGGYVYAKFKENFDKRLAVEYFGQLHWAEARGMDRKFAAGAALRIKFIKKTKTGFFFGTGPFYEYEKWNYRAVLNENLPLDVTPITNRLIKSSTYVSYKHWVGERIFLDLSLYHQAEYSKLFTTPRLGSSVRISYQLTSHLQLVGIYQAMYDFTPVVPIDNWYHNANVTLAISF
ncbi:MAG: DUF481 domain-containing protein [Cytophagales bacterium]|nr:DUF481 domain-containing protein [Cytophagales bacterium]